MIDPEMVLNAQLPEWGPCAGGKSGEGIGDPSVNISRWHVTSPAW